MTPNSRLADCAYSGDLEGVKAALAEGADAKFFDSTPLMKAASAGHLEIVAHLLPLSSPSANSSWALSWACSGGHEKVVSVLIPKSRLVDDECVALLWAAQEGHVGCVELLLDSYDRLSNFFADDHSELLISKLKEDALNAAVLSEHVEVVETMLTRMEGCYLETVFKSAVQTGRVSVVRPFMEHMEDVNGSTALYEAVNLGSMELIRFLMPFADVERVRRDLAAFSSSEAFCLLESVLQEDALRERHLLENSVPGKRQGL